MAKTTFKSVDDYLAGQPRAAQRVLTRVRSAIRKAGRGGEEVISYGIPAYKWHGRIVLYFAAWKQHYSIYPSNAKLEAAFKDELEPYEVSGKGTIRFPLSEPVPVKLIANIAKFRAADVAEREKAKSVASKKRPGRFGHRGRLNRVA